MVVETAGVLEGQGVRELGVNLEGAGPQEVVRGRAAWCGALLTEALCGGRSWRPEVALQRQEEVEQMSESDEGEKEPGGSGWTPHL